MLADEIKGEEEYNAELRAKKATIDDNIFDFDNNDFSPQSPNKNIGNVGDFANDLRQSELIGFRKHSNVKYEDFKLKMLLGRGTFGKVFLAELVKEKKLYAIKAIRKDVLIEYNQVKNTQLEKDILFSCDHPFLVGMDYLF